MAASTNSPIRLRTESSVEALCQTRELADQLDDVLDCLEPIPQIQGLKSVTDKISQAVQLLQSALQESDNFI